MKGERARGTGGRIPGDGGEWLDAHAAVGLLRAAVVLHALVIGLVVRGLRMGGGERASGGAEGSEGQRIQSSAETGRAGQRERQIVHERTAESAREKC